VRGCLGRLGGNEPDHGSGRLELWLPWTVFIGCQWERSLTSSPVSRRVSRISRVTTRGGPPCQDSCRVTRRSTAPGKPEARRGAEVSRASLPCADGLLMIRPNHSMIRRKDADMSPTEYHRLRGQRVTLAYLLTGRATASGASSRARPQGSRHVHHRGSRILDTGNAWSARAQSTGSGFVPIMRVGQVGFSLRPDDQVAVHPLRVSLSCTTSHGEPAPGSW
jgi:hypothetical protein